MYQCLWYDVFNWQGNGYYADNQTGTPTSYFFDDWGIVITQFTPDGGKQHAYDWDPVYGVSPC
jgi:YD repeat-containing protein